MKSLEALLAFPVALAITIGTLLLLWRSFDQHLKAYNLAMEARGALSDYTDETKHRTYAAQENNIVELIR